MIETTRKHALAEIRAWWHKVLFALKKLAPKKPKVIPLMIETTRKHALAEMLVLVNQSIIA